jgi:hypothetical protein
MKRPRETCHGVNYILRTVASELELAVWAIVIGRGNQNRGRSNVHRQMYSNWQ